MNDSDRKFQKDLHAGLVALVLLGVLAHSSEERYGYEIAKQLSRAGDGVSRF
jgi:DNA-binding PadR family transcriptional regulator